MTIQLFDLTAKDDRFRFSPYCWRARMSLLHKGLDFESVPWRFIEKDRISDSGQKAVPVIVDDGKWISDSWDIATYLDQTYPDRPLLMKDAAARAQAQLVIAVVAKQLLPAAIPVAVSEVHGLLDEDNQAYFRQTREKVLGKSLEDMKVSPEAGLAGLGKGLAVFEMVLASNAYLGGDEATYADYALFGMLKWLDIVAPYNPIDEATAVGKWFAGLNAMYDGHGAKVALARNG